MEKVVLKSMVDFVLEQAKNDLTGTHSFLNCYNYANFLKQPLTLGMFVPCDLDGKALEEPNNYEGLYTKWVQLARPYQQAKERCIFEGLTIDGTRIINENSVYIGDLDDTMEDLTEYEPTLTKSAIKQIGL